MGSFNTLVGQAIVEPLRNDHENDTNLHIIVGTMNPEEVADRPRGVKVTIDVITYKILKWKKKSLKP